jgi:hypothetical protein
LRNRVLFFILPTGKNILSTPLDLYNGIQSHSEGVEGAKTGVDRKTVNITSVGIYFRPLHLHEKKVRHSTALIVLELQVWLGHHYHAFQPSWRKS